MSISYNKGYDFGKRYKDATNEVDKQKIEQQKNNFKESPVGYGNGNFKPNIERGFNDGKEGRASNPWPTT